jgi:glucose/mannose-6-phosphate isomerase
MQFPVTREEIERLDASGYLALLTSFDRQIEDALEIMDGVHLDPPGTAIDRVVVAGVGGSAIGGDLLRAGLVDTAPIPIVVNRAYSLPQFVGPSTLVFASSYSGNTEETLSCCREALERGAHIVAITSGGQLRRLATSEGFPLIPIPSGYPPRAALGFSFVALLESMVQLRLAPARREQLQQIHAMVKKKSEQLGIAADAERNPAKRMAMKISGHFPVIYTWGRLEPVAMRWRGQLAEVSKHLSSHHLLPEMNHNEIVAWQSPADLLKRSLVILLRDDQEPRQIARRMEITKELIAPWAAGIEEVWAEGGSPLERLFSLVYTGDFVSFYLAALNGVDPTPIARIDELKRRLAEES